MKAMKEKKPLKYEGWVYSKCICEHFKTQKDLENSMEPRINCQNRKYCKNYCEKCFIELI